MSVISKDQLQRDEISLFRFLLLFNAALLSVFFTVCLWQ